MTFGLFEDLPHRGMFVWLNIQERDLTKSAKYIHDFFAKHWNANYNQLDVYCTMTD